MFQTSQYHRRTAAPGPGRIGLTPGSENDRQGRRPGTGRPMLTGGFSRLRASDWTPGRKGAAANLSIDCSVACRYTVLKMSGNVLIASSSPCSCSTGFCMRICRSQRIWCGTSSDVSVSNVANCPSQMAPITAKYRPSCSRTGPSPCHELMPSGVTSNHLW